MIDMVPKAIMLNLVSWSRENMQGELLTNMYKTDELDELLKESEYTVRRRKDCQQMVESLSKAQEIVNQVQVSSSGDADSSDNSATVTAGLNGDIRAACSSSSE